MRGRCTGAIALLALALTSCRPGGTPPAVNAVPSDSTAVAVIDLPGLRNAAAYAKLPAVQALAPPLDGVKQLVLAWNGRGLLLLASGDYSQPPAGYTEIGPKLAAAGPAQQVEAARKKLAAGTGPLLILPQTTAEIRAAVRGDGNLPLNGNLANLGLLLRMANPTTLTAHVGNTVEVEMAAQCASAEDARQLEESVRGMLTLATAGAKDPEVAATLHDVQTTRENILVRVRGIAKPEVLAKLLGTP